MIDKCDDCGKETEVKDSYDIEFGLRGYERVTNVVRECFECYKIRFRKTFPNETDENLKEMWEIKK